MSVEIVLVRHAQPLWEPNGRAVNDPALTPLGHEQAESAARALAGRRFDQVYMSPLLRVRETSAPILRELGVEPQVEAWLRELGMPDMDGMTPAQVQEFFRRARARDLEHLWEGMPGGESFRHFTERVCGGIEGLLTDHHRLRIHENSGHRIWDRPEAEHRILILAHEGTNAVLISHLLGIEPVPWAWLRFASAHTGISTLRTVPVASGVVWALTRFNEVDHLLHLGEPTA
ncbi:MAG: histidine phosphatase family protein [Proteobacteria bacterium]|nr:histidine phosphatase family protein [Pseudomonadota bacterium]